MVTHDVQGTCIGGRLYREVLAVLIIAVAVLIVNSRLQVAAQKQDSPKVQSLSGALDVWLRLTPYRMVPHRHVPADLKALALDPGPFLPERDWIILGRSMSASQSMLEARIAKLIESKPTSVEKEYYDLLKCFFGMGCIAEAPASVLCDIDVSKIGVEVVSAQIEAISRQMESSSLDLLVKYINAKEIGLNQKSEALRALSGEGYIQMINDGMKNGSTLHDVLLNSEKRLSSIPPIDDPDLEARRVFSLKEVRIELMRY